MRNKLTDLNNHLFAQLEKLGDDDLKGEDLKSEITRSKAIKDIGSQIIQTQRLALDAIKEAHKQGDVSDTTEATQMLLGKKTEG